MRALFLSALIIWTGVTTVSASELFSGEELFKHPFYTNPKISPDGSLVAGQTNDGEKRELVVTDVKTGERYPLIYFTRSNHLSDFHWIDSESIYIQYKYKKESRRSFIQLNRENLSEKPSPQQIKAKGYLLSALPEQENEVLFARNDNDSVDIYQINIRDLASGRFESAQKHQHPLASARLYIYDETSGGYFGFTFDKESESVDAWFLAPGQSAWRHLRNSTDLTFEFQTIQYLKDNEFLVLTNQNTDKVAVAVYDLETQSVKEVIYKHPQFDVVNAETDENGELFSVQYFQHGILQTEYFLEEEELQLQNFIMESEDEDPVYTVDLSADNSKKVLAAYGAAHPGTYVLFDEKTQRNRLIEHLYPNLVQQEFAKTRKITIPTANGESQDAYLTLPYLNGNGVLLVMLDSATSAYDIMTEFSKSAQYFANRGYAVLRVDYGSVFELKDNEQADFEVNDGLDEKINRAVEFAQKEYGYQKTCTLGTGYGGYSAIRLPNLYPHNYDCAISMFGIYDFQLLFSANNASELKLNQQKIKAIMQEKGAELLTQSPVYSASDMSLPVMLVAGKNDNIAIPEQFNRMKYVLNKQTDKLETFFYTSEGHGMRTWHGEQQLHALIDDFLRRHLALQPLAKLGEDIEVAKEYVKIADVYSYDTLDKNDVKKSFEYYVKAAELGHPRAMFNYGSHFHRGDQVEESIEQAIKWYKKAAEAGYDAAAYRLGNLYLGNDDVAKDLEQSHHYFSLANELGFDARASLKQALPICVGEIVPRDEAKCMALLDLNEIKKSNERNRTVKVTDDADDVLFDLLPALILAQGNSSELQQFYVRLLKEHFDVVPTSYDLITNGFGVIDNSGALEIDEQTSDIPMQEGTVFGVHYSLKNYVYLARSKKGLVTRVTRTSVQGDSEVIHETVHKIDYIVNRWLYHELKKRPVISV